MEKEVGTVVSTMEGPSPSSVDFVVSAENKVHRGQFIELDYSEGKMVCMINDLQKTNRYFERAESVKEFESNGRALFEQFPVHEWEYLLAKTRPLGVISKEGRIKRPSFPAGPGTKVRVASNETLKKILHFDEENGMELGELEFHDLKVKLNLTRLLQKHLCILAQSGSGKCLNGNTKIWIEGQEQKAISEIVDPILEKNKKIDGNCEFWQEDLNQRIYALDDFDGKIKPGKILGYARRKAPEELIKITTRTGKVIELTPEHPVPIFNGKIEWINAGQLSTENYLFSPRIEWNGKEQLIDFTKAAGEFPNVEINGEFAKSKFSKAKVRLKHAVDEDLARLFAYLLAEGHNTIKYPRMTFTNENPEIRKEFSRIIGKKFGIECKTTKRGGEFVFDNKLLGKCLAEFGFTKSSWTKFIPKEITASKKEILLAFLAAFIDCDGFVNSKKSEIEITLASKRLSEGIAEIISKMGCISIKKTKKLGEKEYQKLIIPGSEELKKLSALDLKIGYKKKALEKWQNVKSNTNIDVVPNLREHFKELLKLLRMPAPSKESTGIFNYLNRKDNPSRQSLATLVNCFEKRIVEVETASNEALRLYENIPKASEAEALEIIEDAYFNKGLEFGQIAQNSGISSTTARRVVRKITAPRYSAFALAKNVLKKQGMDFEKFESAAGFEANVALAKIKKLCEILNYQTQELCIKTGNFKQFLYYHSNNTGVPEQSKVIKLSEELAILANKSKENLIQAKARTQVLKQALKLNAFFDKIVKIEKIKPASEFVYDLSVENSNFTANGILVHNSYFTSVLLEELLDRKKENGRIAAVMFDTHGEYSSFAEPQTDKSKKDYSSKTILIPSHSIKIGVPKLSAGDFSALMPGMSAPQKRDLGKAISKLKDEMKAGLGPYSLTALMQEVLKNEEGKKTAASLSGWLFELSEMNLFDETDSFSLHDVIRPGFLTIIDFSAEINTKRKQIMASYFLRKLFYERRAKKIPPFVALIEEAHQFAPEGVKFEQAMAKGIIETIAREGRKFGASICLISQRPKRLSTTALSQCNTHLILRITNPYDIKHLSESSEGIDFASERMITSLRVGEALIVGEAVGFPVFFKVRERKSAESRHEVSLEKAALDFEASSDKKTEEVEEFL